MTNFIIVTDEGKIKEQSFTRGDRPSNAYAIFAYGSNGRTKAEAKAEAKAAVVQKAREDKEYSR